MKIRNGFVSNSSSSSFVVKNWDFMKDNDEEECLTEEQITKLTNYGFMPVQTYNAMHVEAVGHDSPSIASPDDCDVMSYAYSVSCNQEDVIEWLVAHDIPFTSACHYGNKTVIFDGEKIHTISNFGSEAEIYGVDILDRYFNKGIIEKFLNLLFGRFLNSRLSRDAFSVKDKSDYKETTELLQAKFGR